jgi:hypothetical protein
VLLIIDEDDDRLSRAVFAKTDDLFVKRNSTEKRDAEKEQPM